MLWCFSIWIERRKKRCTRCSSFAFQLHEIFSMSTNNRVCNFYEVLQLNRSAHGRGIFFSHQSRQLSKKIIVVDMKFQITCHGPYCKSRQKSNSNRPTKSVGEVEAQEAFRMSIISELWSNIKCSWLWILRMTFRGFIGPELEFLQLGPWMMSYTI